MIARLALRTLLAHPVRTAVLAAGFGAGVSVMAILLGVGQIVLDQARSPLLAGGGDVVVSGLAGGVPAPRVLISSTLQAAPFSERIQSVSPQSRATLHLVLKDGRTEPVKVRGGIPSQERALDDPEVAGAEGWTDAADDAPWKSADPAEMLRSIDRFHLVPDVPARAASWAEWLYFNGRAPNARFYLTFLAGPKTSKGTRASGVRLQLERDGKMESYSASAELSPEAVAQAPELTIGGNRIRLSGLRYEIALDLKSAEGRRLTGNVSIEAHRGRQVPPIEIRGALGWVTGYVVPAMSGGLGGSLQVDGRTISFDGGAGYHDHNWGFWEGVSWQWGQVQHEDMSIVFGRVFPPKDAADADRVPGFLMAIGPQGPLGYATRITITETNAPNSARPERVRVAARSPTVDLSLDFTVDGMTTSRLPGPMGNMMDFLQMRGRYAVSGTAGERPIAFESAGSAETFRGR
jgi:hypothetical protein